MSEEKVWNDETRSETRDSIRDFVRGNIRLGRHGKDELIQDCDELFLIDACPEEESKTFLNYASEQFDECFHRQQEEAQTWPGVTDCDRLDRVEAVLRKQGILLWQVSPCCDTCTRAEIPDRIEVIEDRFPGFSEKSRGYGFFIEQNMPEALAEDSKLSVYLGYGWLIEDGADMTDAEYNEKSLEIAREICTALRDEGFEVDWNGDITRKIGVMLNWQRRKPLD